MKDLVMITGRFTKLEVVEEMGKPAVKTGLVDQEARNEDGRRRMSSTIKDLVGGGEKKILKIFC